MNRTMAVLAGLSLTFAFAPQATPLFADAAYGYDEELMPTPTEKADEGQKELMEAKQALDSMSGLEELKPKAAEPKASKKTKRQAEAFVVGPDWEFDGFIAGGQDQNIKSMFSTNDLIYLNVGSGQGFESGDRIGVYRRGERIRDPQNNRVIGFEVRKIAVSEVSDRIEDENCSARILSANEPVEIGDIVRREE